MKQNQVANYNESQKTLQTLIPKEIDFLLRDEQLSPSRVKSQELHLNCNLVLFLKYFREYKKFIESRNQPEFLKTNGLVTWLNEFTDTYYPDFLQMIKEQSNEDYTEQIINSLLPKGEKELYQRWCKSPSNIQNNPQSLDLLSSQEEQDLDFWPASYDDLIAGLKELNNTTMKLKPIAHLMGEEKKTDQNFREFLAAQRAQRANEANEELENYTTSSIVENLEGAKVEEFIVEYLEKIPGIELNRWRKALQYYDSINNFFDADIYIYKKLFANKNHTIDRKTGQRKTDEDDTDWDEDETGWDDDEDDTDWVDDDEDDTD